MCLTHKAYCHFCIKRAVGSTSVSHLGESGFKFLSAKSAFVNKFFLAFLIPQFKTVLVLSSYIAQQTINELRGYKR
jgi:hypothetical protein